MKRINVIFVTLLILSGLFTMQSCKKDTAVAYTEKASFTIPALVSPASGGFLTLTGTTVELKWESTDADGAPEKWNVYFGTAEDPSLVQSDYAQQALTVNVLKGYKYYWRVVGTDANGVITRGPVWSFEIVDPAAPLKMKMDWTTDASTVSHVTLAPDAAVNLRLLILKADLVTTAASIINTAGFEEYNNFSTLADGTYYVVTDIASTVNYNDGTANVPFDISINLTFTQRGKQLAVPSGYAKVLSFPTVMTNKFNCSSYKTVLAKIVKTGNSFTIDKSVSFIVSNAPAALAGTWKGTDFGYPSTIVTTIVGGKLYIDGVGTGWILDPDAWAEVPQSTIPAEVVVNLCAGTFTIANQKFMTTKYLGALQTPYYLQGTGTFDLSGAFPAIKLTYDFIGGTSISPYLGATHFTATLTLNPAGKGLENTGFVAKGLFVKPVLK